MSTVIFLKKIKLVKKLYFDFFKYLTVSLKDSYGKIDSKERGTGSEVSLLLTATAWSR